LTFDAENRMISSVGTLGNGQYVYDANGRRVPKTAVSVADESRRIAGVAIPVLSAPSRETNLLH
jgi:YD repeat-containing protein